MSIINIDNVQHISSNETQQTDDNVYPPPPSYTQISTRTLRTPCQSDAMFSSIQYDNDLISVTVLPNTRNDHHSNCESTFDIHEYTLWSVFNLIFCCIIIGGYALNLSCKTKRKKHRGDLIGARNTSQVTAILNILATLCGILFLTVATLRYTGHILI